MKISIPNYPKIRVCNLKRDARCKLTIEDELKAAKLYKSGLSLNGVAKRLNVTGRCIQNVLRAYNIKSRTSGDGVRLLHDHLLIDPPIDFPWYLRKNFQKLISVFLLTDGYANKNRIEFICKDKILQRYFLTLFKEEFNLAPTPNSFMQKDKETTINGKDALSVLFKLSPSYVKCPRNKSKEIYSREPQPSLIFLENENLELLMECVRIAMSTEGSIHVDFSKNTIYPRLEFACAHPLILKEWQKIFNLVGINSNIAKSRSTWSGIKGLRISKIKSIEKFIEIRGFIEGVEITGKSKFYSGITKNSLLKILFEMKKNSFQFPTNFTLKGKHKIIRNMITNVKAKEKWWRVCVEEPRILKMIKKQRKELEELKRKLEKKLKREKIKLKIIEFVKKSSMKRRFPTWEEINKILHLDYKNYFESIASVYKLAEIKYPRKVKRIAKPPFMTKKEGKEAIKNYILEKTKKGVLPSRKEIENDVRIRLSVYFKNVNDAYKYAGVEFKRTSPFKRAVLVSVWNKN